MPTNDELLALLSRDGEMALALTLYGEGRGEPIEGIIGIAAVIRNRVQTKYRGATYPGVVLAPEQFSCWNADDPNRGIMLALVDDFYIESNARVSLRECRWIAQGCISGAMISNVRAARHYHAEYVAPVWAAGARPVAHLGRHLFYEGIP